VLHYVAEHYRLFQVFYFPGSYIHNSSDFTHTDCGEGVLTESYTNLKWVNKRAEAKSCYETSADVNLTKRGNIPGDSHLRISFHAHARSLYDIQEVKAHKERHI
jgi:hypothetical protein